MPDAEAPRVGPALADRLALAVALVATALGVGWRLVDVTEWPFPPSASVQYESALAARALWVAADPAARTPERAAWFAEVRFGHVVSPPVLPALVAATYAATGQEIPWASKLFTAGFWAAAGWLVAGAVARQTGSRWAGAVALTYLMFAPFGLMVSRSFQTESAAVLGFAFAAWHLSRPGRGFGWRETAASGVACGLAALVKPGTLLPPLAAGFAALALGAHAAGGLPRRAAAAGLFTLLLAVPSVAYVGLFLSGRGGEIQPHLLADADFYRKLGETVYAAVGSAPLAAGLAGAALAAWRGVPLAAGLFAGHAALAAAFTYHCSTHAYYHTTLLVPVALGVGWVAAELLRLAGAALGPSRRADLLVAAVVAGCLARYVVVAKTPWVGPWRLAAPVREGLAAEYARERAMGAAARAARDAVPPGARAVAVTADYGYVFESVANLRVAVWPRRSDLTFLLDAGAERPATADERLTAYAAAGYEYLVVTDFAEYAGQPDLAEALARRGRPILATPEVLVFAWR